MNEILSQDIKLWHEALKAERARSVELERQAIQAHLTGFWRGLVCGMAVGLATMQAAEILLR